MSSGIRRAGSWSAPARTIVLPATIAAILGSCAPQPTAPARTANLGTYVDDSPTWSRDGEWIAFHRRFRSSDGPPGAYVVRRWGGKPRFFFLGDFIWPTDMRFSPDAKRVVCKWGKDVAVIEVETGDMSYPVSTTAPSTDPDWSPDGNRLVYVRPRYSSPTPVPPESLGIHILDLDSGVDRPLRRDGKVVDGFRPRWSPDGSFIAYDSFGPGGSGFRVHAIRPDGTDYRLLAGSNGSHPVDNLQWLSSRGAWPEGVLFNFSMNPPSTQFARSDGSGYTRWPITFKPWDSVSHDGEWIARVLPNPDDGLWVIHVGRTHDVLGSSYTRITSYSPPQTLVSAESATR